jgi:hypothetical protein
MQKLVYGEGYIWIGLDCHFVVSQLSKIVNDFAYNGIYKYN